jgi:hypothetical protein
MLTCCLPWPMAKENNVQQAGPRLVILRRGAAQISNHQSSRTTLYRTARTGDSGVSTNVIATSKYALLAISNCAVISRKSMYVHKLPPDTRAHSLLICSRRPFTRYSSMERNSCSGIRRSGLGEHSYRRLSLSRDKVVRKYQSRRIHERGGGSGEGIPSIQGWAVRSVTPRPPAQHSAAPWRPNGQGSRRSGGLVIRKFGSNEKSRQAIRSAP